MRETHGAPVQRAQAGGAGRPSGAPSCGSRNPCDRQNWRERNVRCPAILYTALLFGIVPVLFRPALNQHGITDTYGKQDFYCSV